MTRHVFAAANLSAGTYCLPLRQHPRKTAPLPLLGPRIELLALININQERGRLRLIKLLKPVFGRIEQTAQRVLFPQ